jgi:hypothetical protein
MSKREALEQPNLLHLILYIGGGLCTGAGILLLYGSFGWEAGPLSSDFASIGFSSLDNIHPLGASDYSIALVVAGALALVYASATAWKKTDGH